jgi:hypothetical protein
MRTRIGAAIACAVLGGVPALAQSAPDAALGKQLYLTGKRADGAIVAPRAEGDVPLSGPRIACVACHRPSGFGSSEGGYFTPPITGPILFHERQLDRARFTMNRFGQAESKLFRARLAQPRMRPAYTSEALARVLREGVDAGGHKLDAAMPRYDLSDADVANLAAYLQSLSATPDAGVTEQELHIATVIGPDLPAAQRTAVLATLQAYVDWTNKNLSGEASRPGFSPFHRNDVAGARRLWRLHVWELRGPPETWPAQLQTYYEQQPVFTLVSGLAKGSWRPIAEFCDANRLPALFPVTDRPAADKSESGYTFYFSKGERLEAAGLAAFLAARTPPVRSVLQIIGDGGSAAESFARTLHAKASGVAVSDAAWPRAGADVAMPDRTLDAIVIWPGEAKDEALASLIERLPKNVPVLLPSDRISWAAHGLSRESAARVLFADPYELPAAVHPLAFRVRAWMRSRRLEIDEPRLQFQAYYAASLLDAALSRLINDFYREYLVEAIESEAEGDLNPGVYPSLVLGPGQRFASKGIFVVRADPASPDAIAPASDWITP